MLRGNTITLRLARGHVSQTGNLFQYDYGQRLILMGVDLPNAYEVHFSNQEHGQSKTMIGDATGVDIPDEFLLSGDNIHVWIYLHDGSSDGETEYHGIIGVTKRAKPTDQQPTPVQQSVIDQAIAALNAGVTEVEGIAEGIPQTIDNALEEAKESGEFDGFSPVIETTEITGGHQVSITDATHTETINVMDGEKGDPGRDGVDGFSPSASVSKSGKVATISITDKDGTTTAKISDGEDGQDGSDGFSPSASVSKSGKIATISITDKDGTTSAQISDGEDGQDGATGATPVISIGTVSKLSPGSDPTASMDTTDPEHPVLSLGLVTGDPGEVSEAELQQTRTELLSALDLKADLIHDTVTDVAIASVSDGAANLPLSALVIGIDPVQDTSGGDPSPSHVCPITGRTGAVVSCGPVVDIGTLYNNGLDDYGEVNTYTYYWHTDYIDIRNAEQVEIAFAAIDSGWTYRVCSYNASKQFVELLDKKTHITGRAYSYTYDSTDLDGAAYLRFSFVKNGNNPTVTHFAVVHDMHPVQFGQTVYGGEVDWVNGVLVVDHVIEDLGNLNWNYATSYGYFAISIEDMVAYSGGQMPSIICDTYKTTTAKGASDWSTAEDKTIGTRSGISTLIIKDTDYNNKDTFKAAVTGKKVVYPLATPITVPLTGLDEIKTAQTAGVNNFWADSGDIVELTYPCDTKGYINKKLAELTALILENN